MSSVEETSHSRPAGSRVDVVPGFALLFSVALAPTPDVIRLERMAAMAKASAFAEHQLAEYQLLRSEAELHVLGRPFVDAGRLTQTPIGNFTLESDSSDPQGPVTAQVRLFSHVGGVALWEAWVVGEVQDFDVERWVRWLDDLDEHSLPARIWRLVRPLNVALGGTETYLQYLPCSVIRLSAESLSGLGQRLDSELVTLLWRDRASRPLKPEVVDAELARDHCAREGGITLLGRRSAVDVHGREDEAAMRFLAAGLPPRSALPLLVTLELLLIERAVLTRLYEQLSRRTPRSIESLLQLKQQVDNGLEEYYGATMAITRFGDRVAQEGEQLLGIVELHEALVNRLETVSFTLTTRYQRRMTALQFWLTVVFGATEIGFIAASIATWHYRTELVAVLSWTVGAAAASAGVLVGLLRWRGVDPAR